VLLIAEETVYGIDLAFYTILEPNQNLISHRAEQAATA
jgi:hypothetical protein